MRHRTLLPLLAAFLLAASSAGLVHAQAEYSIKEEKIAAPEALNAEIRKLLDDNAVQFLDAKGTVLCEIWFRKELPSKATPDKAKKGLTYQDIPETTILGAIRVNKVIKDYRDQKIREGVYTMRFGMQPQDGDHMGTAPHPEFSLLVPAKLDTKPGTLDPKDLEEMSLKATTRSHPAIFLLFPLLKDPAAEAKLTTEMTNHWVLTRPIKVKVGDQTITIGVPLTLVGVSSAA